MILPKAVARLTGAARERVASRVDEALDDLLELGYLIDGLTELSLEDDNEQDDQYAPSKRWFSTNFRQSIQALKSRHRKQLDLVDQASRHGHFGRMLDTVRKEYLAMKSALRAAYRQRGMILCASDWQSPIYSSSIPVESNRLSDGIAEHSWDYKRDGHLDAQAYERSFTKEYAEHLGFDRLKAYLMNSGMAGFTTVLHWLAHEMRLGQSVLALEPMYFENLHLAKAFFPQVVQLKAPSLEELAFRLRTLEPSVVLCDAVTNCGEIMAHDFEAVIDWARTEAKHQVAIVIDTTCLPTALMAAHLFQGLPENVMVFLVESLAKHHQFGMDTVTGGVVLAGMSDSLQDSFRKTRARLGTNIVDSSVGSLPEPSRMRLLKRMERHVRNTRMLAQVLDDQTEAKIGAIESVAWLSDGAKSTPWYRGSCLNLRLRPAFRSIDSYKEFERNVLELSKARNFPVAFSTSFGFDVSRLYVTAPSTKFEEPFLRIAVGTETAAHIHCLAEILMEAAVELVRSAMSKSEAGRSGKDVLARGLKVAEPPVKRTGIESSVFLGQDALKRYLCPANYAPTPLVELPADLNPFLSDGVRMFAKMMPLVPLMNIKSVPAFSMLAKAAERGDLAGVERIIESSSSNTVLSLSVIAKLFGIDSTCAIVDHSIAPSLVRMLRLFGIEIFMHPGMGHELYGKLPPRSERASLCGKQPGWFNPGQYSNPDNPEGFARWLAPDLWAQTDGRLQVLSCGLGTCGTMVGVSRGLRQRNSDIQVVACCPKSGDAVPGPRERSQLTDVSFSWQEVPNANVELTSKESFAASIQLLRRGILGGPSSGMNYAGLLNYVRQQKDAGLLKGRMDANGELWCVFLCCDSPLPHVDEYYDALGDDQFSPIHPVPTQYPSLSLNDDN
jgi:cysteine synthase/cystathionine beta-lyase/cystathionine gamma-synthase